MFRLMNGLIANSSETCSNRASYLVIGITGHRDISSQTVLSYIREFAHDFFSDKLRQYNNLEVLSALATGADTILADVALEMGINLTAIIPFSNYHLEFMGDDLNQYYRMLNRAAKIVEMPFDDRSRDAFLSTGIWIVDNADMLIAVWDGQLARGKGGTADVVSYARSQKKETVIIPFER